MGILFRLGWLFYGAVNVIGGLLLFPLVALGVKIMWLPVILIPAPAIFIWWFNVLHIGIFLMAPIRIIFSIATLFIGGPILIYGIHILWLLIREPIALVINFVAGVVSIILMVLMFWFVMGIAGTLGAIIGSFLAISLYLIIALFIPYIANWAGRLLARMAVVLLLGIHGIGTILGLLGLVLSALIWGAVLLILLTPLISFAFIWFAHTALRTLITRGLSTLLGGLGIGAIYGLHLLRLALRALPVIGLSLLGGAIAFGLHSLGWFLGTQALAGLGSVIVDGLRYGAYLLGAGGLSLIQNWLGRWIGRIGAGLALIGHALMTGFNGLLATGGAFIGIPLLLLNLLASFVFALGGWFAHTALWTLGTRGLSTLLGGLGIGAIYGLHLLRLALRALPVIGLSLLNGALAFGLHSLGWFLGTQALAGLGSVIVDGLRHLGYALGAGGLSLIQNWLGRWIGRIGAGLVLGGHAFMTLFGGLGASGFGLVGLLLMGLRLLMTAGAGFLGWLTHTALWTLGVRGLSTFAGLLGIGGLNLLHLFGGLLLGGGGLSLLGGAIAFGLHSLGWFGVSQIGAGIRALLINGLRHLGYALGASGLSLIQNWLGRLLSRIISGVTLGGHALNTGLGLGLSGVGLVGWLRLGLRLLGLLALGAGAWFLHAVSWTLGTRGLSTLAGILGIAGIHGLHIAHVALRTPLLGGIGLLLGGLLLPFVGFGGTLVSFGGSLLLGALSFIPFLILGHVVKYVTVPLGGVIAGLISALATVGTGVAQYMTRDITKQGVKVWQSTPFYDIERQIQTGIQGLRDQFDAWVSSTPGASDVVQSIRDGQKTTRMIGAGLLGFLTGQGLGRLGTALVGNEALLLSPGVGGATGALWSALFLLAQAEKNGDLKKLGQQPQKQHMSRIPGTAQLVSQHDGHVNIVKIS